MNSRGMEVKHGNIVYRTPTCHSTFPGLHEVSKRAVLMGMPCSKMCGRALR